MGKFVDLTGQKFGRLTVIERAENKGKQTYWLCKCECGNDKVVAGCSLKSGATMSCGCLASEKSSKRMKEQTEKQWQDEDFRKMKSEKTKEQMKKQWQDEDFRKMKSEQMKKQWQDEDFRKMQSEKIKRLNEKQWQDEDYKQKMSDTRKNAMKKQWQDEDFRKMKSEQMKKQWQDEEMKWKMHYKGGITPITQYLRNSNSQWLEDCKQKANYTCQLTGKRGGLNTHHLKAFSTIVIEAHQLHDIDIKPQVKDYTEEELRLLEEYVASWHKDNSNAVVLSEDVHNLFHKLYGKGNNTPEQFEEFKERYLAGEFKEILK